MPSTNTNRKNKRKKIYGEKNPMSLKKQTKKKKTKTGRLFDGETALNVACGLRRRLSCGTIPGLVIRTKGVRCGTAFHRTDRS